VVEILEQEHGHPALVNDINWLSKRGFLVALDDFDMKYYRPELIDAADIIKLDVLAYDQEGLTKAVQQLRQHKVRLLAEKVENYEMFNLCRNLGFDLFQGFFFCRPEIVRGYTLDTNRRALLELIKEVYQPDVSIPMITEIVKRDVVLSFKLLKLVNSSFYRRAQNVESFSHAIVLLGVQRIRSWATLVTLGNISQKPDELQKESLTRAYMCEYLGEPLGEPAKQMCFSAGLLSCLDAWFDYPLDELINMLPLSQELRSAIIEQTGDIGRLLPIVIGYIHSNWNKIHQDALTAVGLDYHQVSEAYAYAVSRTDSLTAELIAE
jgi:EAL and modified HD-GYP domain-containing signal transduction protein